MNTKVIVLGDLNDGKETIAYEEESAPIVDNNEIESMVSDFDDEQRKNGKDYDLQRNGKKLIKTEIKYVYKVKENGGFVYRLLFKDDITGEKVDTWQMFNPNSDKKAPFRTVGEASQHMFRRLEELKTKGKTTRKTFGDVWEEFKRSPHDRANETIRRYESIYVHHIKELLGNADISAIPTEKYNELLVLLHRTGDGKGSKINGYSYDYVKSILKFIYLVVSYAYRMNYVSTETYMRFENELKMPSRKKESDKKKIRVLSNSQIIQVKDLLKDTDFYLPFLIAVMGGLRPAEVFALCFEDFDYSKGTVDINKQLVEETDGKRIIKQPKTEGSKRTVELPRFVIEEVQKKEKLLAECKVKSPLLFEQNKLRFLDGRNFKEEIIEQPNFINVDTRGRFIPAHSFSYYTKIIKEKICPNQPDIEDFSFYTFRKTHLSNMAANNCPIGELMKRAGHTKIETIYTYYYNRTNESEKKVLQAMYQCSKVLD